MSYIFYFLSSAFLIGVLTPLAIYAAKKYGILDYPKSERKIHTRPIPFLGGLAIYLAVVFAILLYLQTGKVDYNVVPLKFFSAIIGGGAILMIGGVLDDKFDLPPKLLWLFPALASLVIVYSGIGVGITQLSNPFGAPINLNFKVLGISFSAIFIWLWMMGMIFTTKFLDGLDGLCAGISLIGGFTLFALSLLPHINQPITATLAIIFCGSLVGYLFYASYPASIFLGEEGSTLMGFMLGVLSVITGGKIATALLVMGIPILDVAWVIFRRIWYRTSPFRADRKHLHFRLLDIGFSQRQTVFILYTISAIFGATAVFLQSLGKLIALVILFCVMLVLAIFVVVMYKSKKLQMQIEDSKIKTA